jgi:transposase
VSKLDLESRMTIKTLLAKRVTASAVARLLGVTEGAVRYQARRMQSGAVDGRSLQPMRAEAVAEAIGYWRESQGEVPLNLAALHEWLVREHDYSGSLRSVQRYWSRNFPVPRLRARRRVETPPAAQAQVDWAAFPGIVLGGERTDLLSLHMVLSHSRMEAVVWSPRKDLLAWLSCHTQAFRRLGGVTATVRVDNEKTAVVHGAGAWGTIHPAYRRYALLLRFHVDACAPRAAEAKGKVERQVRTQRAAADPSRQAWRDLAELQAWSDEQTERLARRRRCPITGQSVWESWLAERELLTPLPEPLPEPFDLVLTRQVGIDAIVAFEGRQYSVPFVHVGKRVEVRGCATTVQILAGNAIVAVHPRHSRERLLINPAHYEGPGSARIAAPTPLGRLGRRLQELAQVPVAHRAIDLYARLAEVAR